MYRPCMAQERECNEGCQLTKLLFSFNLEITEEGMERQQENTYTVGPLIQYSSPSRLLPPPALPGGWYDGQ